MRLGVLSSGWGAARVAVCAVGVMLLVPSAATAHGCSTSSLNAVYPAIRNLQTTGVGCAVAAGVARGVQRYAARHPASRPEPRRIGPIDGQTFRCAYRQRVTQGNDVGDAVRCRSGLGLVTFQWTP